MKSHAHPILLIALAMILIGSFLGCGEQPSSQSESSDPSTPKGESSAKEEKEEPAPPQYKPTDQLAKSFSDALDGRREATEVFVKDFLKQFKKNRRKNTPWSALIQEIYSPKSPRLHFIQEGKPTEAAFALIRRLEELPSHGLSRKALARYDMKTIQALRDKIKEREDAVDALYANEKENKGMGVLVELIKEYTKGGEAPTPEELEIIFQERGLSNDDVDAVPLAIAHHDALLEAQKNLNKALQVLEFELIEAFLQYACDFRFTKVAHPFRAMKNPDSAPKAFHKRLMKLYGETDFADLDNELVSWWPDNPIYEKTRNALAFYEELANGPEQPLLNKKTVLKPGMTGPPVETLQKRLQQEGFYTGPVNGTFDEPTKEATIRYQKTHQLDADGIVGGGTIRSFNLSYKQRVRQIRLSLQRWRESETRGQKGFHVRVNIPQFEAEFWANDNLERVHRVVVGSNRWEVDTEKGIEGNLNRTMIFSNEMTRVVLNPLWHVPKRIKEIELDEFLTKNPDYYEANNFTVEILEDGSEKVYQNPGPENALGLAKFLFPNEYSIYMHDTPKKHLFAKRQRAFSHGCMRVENATELAEYILSRDQKMEREEVKSAFAALKTRDLTLNTPISIHVEYNTVSVDADGNVLFYGDIYGYDQDFYNGKVPIDLSPKKLTDG